MTDNPKMVTAQKQGKAPMERIPWKPMAAVARVMFGGGEKYGIRNFLMDEIRASTYIGTIARHALLEWAQGVDTDKDSGEHPLAHVIANCLIVMDSEDHGTLIDDRLIQESIDPDTGEKRTFDPLDDDIGERIQQVFETVREYNQLSAKIANCGLNNLPFDAGDRERWAELHKSAPFELISPDATDERHSDDLGDGD